MPLWPTYEVNMSTVRSVSGLLVDVLKLGPLSTVNHWPFLPNWWGCWSNNTNNIHRWEISLRLRRSARIFSPASSIPVEAISCMSFLVVSDITGTCCIRQLSSAPALNILLLFERTSLIKPLPSFPIQPFLKARPWPILAVSSPTSFFSSAGEIEVPLSFSGRTRQTRASCDPSLAICAPSGVRTWDMTSWDWYVIIYSI